MMTIESKNQGHELFHKNGTLKLSIFHRVPILIRHSHLVIQNIIQLIKLSNCSLVSVWLSHIHISH